jgi:hypothetical protein
MSSFGRNTKDYTDDWEAFTNGLKAKSTLDLTYYARNLVNAAARIDGDDDFANALFEKLTKRARLCNEELRRRSAYNAPKTTLEDRKRKVDELRAMLPNDSGVDTPSSGATYLDRPIPTRITPLASTSTPSPLSCPEDLEKEEDTQEYNHSQYKKFRLDFEKEEDK